MLQLLLHFYICIEHLWHLLSSNEKTKARQHHNQLQMNITALAVIAIYANLSPCSVQYEF